MKNRLGYIDTGRGLSAIMVLFFHAILWFFINEENGIGADIEGLFQDYFDLGKISVLVFFIISGLVIPYSIRGSSRIAIKKFVVSRFFRLYPVYWVSAILGFLLIGGFTYKELVANLTMLQQFVGIRNIIGLYWTLQIELIFYFLIVLVFLTKRLANIKFLFGTSVAFLIVSLVFAIFRGYMMVKLPLGLALALSLMFFGSFYRYYLLEGNKQSKRFANMYLIAYFVSIPIICKLGYDIDFGQNENWFKYTTTYYLGLLLFLLLGKLKMSNNVTEYLGRISYSVYLFHPLLIYAVWKIDLLKGVHGFVKVLLVLVSTILVSHILYKLVEAPAIQIGRRVKRRLVDKGAED